MTQSSLLLEFWRSPVVLFMSGWKNRDLIWQMTKREIAGRYRGSFLGILWSFFNPISMLIVYTFVFGVVFRARWLHDGVGKSQFAIIIFAGLIVYNLFSELVNRAPTLIVSNVNYVKKVLFPLEILPMVGMGAALFHFAISVLVLFLFAIVVGTPVAWTVVFLPLVLAPFVFLTMGFAWFVASLGVFVRDIGQVVAMLTSLLLFLSPIFYPMSALPPSLQSFMILNPLTFVIEQTRNVTIWGVAPEWRALMYYYLVALTVMFCGFFWFQKTRKGFADVL